MSTIKLAGALTDPKEVSGAIIVEARSGVLASKGLLVGKQEALMGGPELGGGHDGMVHGEPGGSHEPQSLIHPVGQLPIPVVSQISITTNTITM